MLVQLSFQLLIKCSNTTNLPHSVIALFKVSQPKATVKAFFGFVFGFGIGSVVFGSQLMHWTKPAVHNSQSNTRWQLYIKTMAIYLSGILGFIIYTLCEGKSVSSTSLWAFGYMCVWANCWRNDTAADWDWLIGLPNPHESRLSQISCGRWTNSTRLATASSRNSVSF